MRSVYLGAAVAALFFVTGCDSDPTTPPSTGSGGAGGSCVGSDPHDNNCFSGGAGGAPTTTSTTTTTSTSDEPVDDQCSLDPQRVSCIPNETPPGDFFDPAGAPGLAVGSLLPWELRGGPIACSIHPGLFGPITRARIGFAGEPPPELTLDVWTEPVVNEPPARVWAATPRPLVSIEKGTGAQSGVTFGLYEVPTLEPDGQRVCIFVEGGGTYAAPALDVVDCEPPTVTQWLGLPWHDDDSDGEVDGASELTRANLACPVDTTASDGTPAVAPYHAFWPFGVR